MRVSSTLTAGLALVTVAIALGGESAGPEGIWEGRLSVGAGIELRVVLRVAKTAGGSLKATVDSPDQGATGLKVDSVAIEADALTFTMTALKAEFRGTVNVARTEAVGRWKQAGSSLPLTLRKTDRPTEPRRPQNPRPPFPYDEKPASYDNKAAGITLAGTLTTPIGRGPFPAVILISGSGAQDRDESILGHRPFFVLADFLTRRGIAVLRVDDRGVGGSTGKTLTSTTEDFAGDVQAGIVFLKTRPEINPMAIGLIGHSEGGLIAPLVAARSGDVAYIVLMAGTGLTGEEILYRQGELIFKAIGLKDDKLRMNLELQRRLIAIVKAEKDEKAAAKKMKAIIKEALDAGESSGPAEAQLALARSPWFRFFLTYDPGPALAQVRCPVLALGGEHDLQVPPKENLAAIEKALRSGGNRRVTVRELHGLNHLFQTSKTGSPSEYATIEETISPSALNVIGDWIAEQVQELSK